MVRVALFLLVIALLVAVFAMLSPDIKRLQQLKQENAALIEQVGTLKQQLELSELEQERLNLALQKAQAAKIERLYE